MEAADILKLAGQGGGFLVVLAAFVWLVRSVGLALVASIKDLGVKVDEHTKLDLEHHADVRAAIVRVEAKIDGMEIERDRGGEIVPRLVRES